MQSTRHRSPSAGIRREGEGKAKGSAAAKALAPKPNVGRPHRGVPPRMLAPEGLRGGRGETTKDYITWKRVPHYSAV